jgi:subtilisin family serine protease
MDVFFKLIFVVLFITACSQNKTTDSVFTQQKIGSVSCPTDAVMPNQFIVEYEDGNLEVIHSPNVETFKSDFVKPRLEKIKAVEFDSKIFTPSVLEAKTSEISTTASASDWGQSLIKAPEVWNQDIRGQGITIAVLDQAVDVSHASLKNRIFINAAESNGAAGVDDDKNGYIDDYLGWNFITNSTSTVINNPTQYHGTHVAGIVAGESAGSDFTGVAPLAKILPATFLDEKNGSAGTAILAMRYSVQMGAKVLNASWGGYDCSNILREEIAGLEFKNVLFIAAAGNSSADYDRGGRWEYPAVFNLPSMLSVAASNTQDFLASFSNRSFFLVHLAAPGDAIRSTVPYSVRPSGFEYLSGTSMAAPFVSGAAALLWSAKPNASASQIRQALINSVDYKQLKVSSQGRLNLVKAVEEIRRIAP